ncbi:hypothetical protein NDU88_002528 [Pleurodeles waltl]|uniref:Myb/SANT-like DNA-binding domain-containing protein n=1 Tax=Pleurodeles waltl TaxID=8319 RepID=A0AAV7Q7D4_PLEWA|nr:hypothetical protein NDU88_002528 [Pleurodeles waltl]
MTTVSGERAPAFTAEELDNLVAGVLPQYTLLYGPPDKQVSAHQKKGIWRAIAKEVRTMGVYHRRSTHCRKRWEDLRRWSKKMAEAQLGMASQRVKGCPSHHDPPDVPDPGGGISRLGWALEGITGATRGAAPCVLCPPTVLLLLALTMCLLCLVTLPLYALASSGGGAVALEQEGAATHMAQEGECTESEGTSGMEGEGSAMTGTGGDTSDSDSSSDGSSLAVAGTSVPTATTGTAATPPTSTAHPAATQRVSRAR